MDNNNPSVVAMSVLAAVAKLDAEPAGRKGWWQYKADEINMVCFVRTKELAELGSLLADLKTRRDAYSLWCTSVPTRETLPARRPSAKKVTATLDTREV